MKLLRLALLCALGAVGVLVIMPPASLLGAWLPEPFRLHYASGTLWQGQVLLATDRPLCPLAWKYAGFSERTLSIDLTLGAPCSGRAMLDLKPEGAALRQLELELPAALVVQFIPKLQSWQLGGRFSLNSPRLALTPATLGEGDLTWIGAQLARLPIAKLGDYTAHFTLNGHVVEARVSTLQGPLNLEGDLGFADTPRANLIASSDDPKIALWIRTLGIMEGPGQYRLRIQ